jgi:enterochelin esterase family protein
MYLLALAILAIATAFAQPVPLAETVKLVKAGSPKAREVLGDQPLKEGKAWLGEGPDFLFAVDAKTRPQLVIDDAAPVPMQKAGEIWYATSKLAVGRSHNFSYLVDGTPFGGVESIPAFTPLSYPKPGSPEGKLDGKHVHTSQIYPGMKSDYWIYVPAQYDAGRPAAVMIWQDGEGLVVRDRSRAQFVFDNLSAEKKIPVIVHILISPGLVDGKQRMRSIEYDTMDDRYARFLRDEILPEVAKKYNLRTDAYSRAIAGNSSGGICAFNAAYRRPELFSRVLSRVGSFTSIQWKPGVLDGGNLYPFLIRKDTKKNIRVWLQDGSNDLENNHGSWPLQNIAMANSLKMMEYDFHLSWGNGAHSGSPGNAELPDELIWLWRDYDPGRTEQVFTMDPAEKTKPMFRVKALNRE